MFSSLCYVVVSCFVNAVACVFVCFVCAFLCCVFVCFVVDLFLLFCVLTCLWWAYAVVFVICGG